MKYANMIPALLLAWSASTSVAQWDPNNGDWGKENSRDIRVMTWNVQDGICRTNQKSDSFNNWNGIVRIVASLQPDVLILQECADNSGNGTGSGADSVAQLNDVANMFVNGGPDIYLGGSVGSYLKLFVPSYDLPYVYSSTNSDGFNRNLILSRFPIEDINNGGGAAISNFVLIPDAYQSGGSGGIRGFQFAEINLPDAEYAGDMVIGNAHLKAGGSSSDYAQRETASFNTSYYIDYYYNGAGTGMSDPNLKIVVPNAGDMLDEFTPVIWGGDLNENPTSSSPNSIQTRAEFFGGLLLILGFLVRPAALALATTMVVAIMTVHINNGLFMSNNGYEFGLALLVVSIGLVIRGAGSLSADYSLHNAQASK